MKVRPLKAGFVVALLLALPSLPSVSRGAEIPRPEHPFPQAERAEWLNLNGTWEFAETDDDKDEGFLSGKAFPDRIVVPFARESKLSGLARRGFIRNVWYRRTFSRPEWAPPRTVLHIGACDYRTRVWVNGKLAGVHVGGSAGFAFEVTSLLKPGENSLVVHAFDDTRSGLQPCGKQAQQPESNGCVYTRTTGIWQTVWLEGVGSSWIPDFSIVPDPAALRVHLQVDVAGPSSGLSIEATASLGGKEVGRAAVPAAWRNGRLVLDLSERRLWSPGSPALYDLELILRDGSKVVDRVRSYFGLRAVTIEGRAILLNGEPVFQRTVLDQGFYPDGVWTAPSDEALRRDIELSMAVGFNGARLHQKVFEPRFHYWADRLGYLTWGEFPNWGVDYERRQIDLPYIAEWTEVVLRDRNHPSIIGWCPFNETPPSAGPLQAVVVAVTRSTDPTRPVIESSGYAHTIPDPQVLDAHDYDGNPESFRARWASAFSSNLPLPARYGSAGAGLDRAPFFVSEFGGIGWFQAGDPAWGYGNNPKDLDELYARFQGLVDAQLDNPNLFGYCYTQLTDIEQERNGLYYYDRTPKFDAAKLRAIQTRKAAYETDPPLGNREGRVDWKVLVAAGVDGPLAREWRYSLDDPGAGWTGAAFDDGRWKTGRAGFGQKGGWEGRIGTPWSGKDIWLRQQVAYDGSPFGIAALVIHYDNATEVYLNGAKVWSGVQWNDAYAGFEITDAVRKALVAGKNTIAVHCHQDEGGQFIDLALLLGNRSD